MADEELWLASIPRDASSPGKSLNLKLTVRFSLNVYHFPSSCQKAQKSRVEPLYAGEFLYPHPRLLSVTLLQERVWWDKGNQSTCSVSILGSVSKREPSTCHQSQSWDYTRSSVHEKHGMRTRAQAPVHRYHCMGTSAQPFLNEGSSGLHLSFMLSWAGVFPQFNSHGLVLPFPSLPVCCHGVASVGVYLFSLPWTSQGGGMPPITFL